jgi:2'-5' RNA ligase
MEDKISHYSANEYLLLLSPHEDLCNKIMNIKRAFYESYQSSNVLFNKPHITLVKFTQYSLQEDRIINRLHHIAMAFAPTKIELRDYGSFPSHTIYIQVVSKLPIQSLVKTIRAEAQKLMKFNDERKPHFILEPHVTIARKLQPWQYEKGWLEYSHRNFTGRFIADSMLLLKRKLGEMKYQIVSRFAFENLPIATVQGALFS